MKIRAYAGKREIDHGIHGSCYQCLLGETIQKYLKPGYITYIETDYPDESDEATNCHARYSIMSRSSYLTLITEKLPKTAASHADVWEGTLEVGKYIDDDGNEVSFEKLDQYSQADAKRERKDYLRHEGVEIKPFRFWIEIPDEALKPEYLNK